MPANFSHFVNKCFSSAISFLHLGQIKSSYLFLKLLLTLIIRVLSLNNILVCFCCSFMQVMCPVTSFRFSRLKEIGVPECPKRRGKFICIYRLAKVSKIYCFINFTVLMISKKFVVVQCRSGVILIYGL